MRRLFYLALFLPLLFAACGEKNDMVLDTEDMASLMADIHMGEAVVDFNHTDYNNDSTRMALKQSIYIAHGVTAEQVDSSYIWYGHHIEEYMKVYERVVELLEARQKDMLAASDHQIIMEGDSVDIWPLSRRLEFSRRTASRLITFSIPADSNWRDNDVFTLRYNIARSTNPITSRMTVEYADGSTAFNLAAGRSKGPGELSVRIDSTRMPVRISGYILAKPNDDESVRLDSLSLTRMRSHLARKYFSMRPFSFGVKHKAVAVEKPDTSAAAVDSVSAETNTQQTGNNRTIGGFNSRHSRHGKVNAHPATVDQSKGSTPSQPNKNITTGKPGKSASKPAAAAPAGTAGKESAAQRAKRQRDEMLRNAGKK